MNPNSKAGVRKIIKDEIMKSGGILRLKPAWVARDFIPPGRRLGLPQSDYELGPRGGICERWLASTTKADNKVGVPNEGLSLLDISSPSGITLREGVEYAGDLIMGK